MQLIINLYLLLSVATTVLATESDSSLHRHEGSPSPESLLKTRDNSMAGECRTSDSHENCSKLDQTMYALDDVVPATKTDKILLNDSIEYTIRQFSTRADVSTLRQVLFLHRHGDRTPIQFPPGDTIAKEPFWAFNGYGQLTNRGKARLHLLGKMMRFRYNQFLDGSVNKNQRISRSSGSLRCIESAQVFLSSFLSLNMTGSPDANELIWDRSSDVLAQTWQPASIQSVPAEMDGMLAESANCNSLMEEYEKVIEKMDVVQKLYTDYKLEADILNEIYQFKVDHFYKWFWASSQIEVERSYFPDKIDPRILAIYDRLQEAGEQALTAYQSTLTSKRLRSGLLMNDMIQNMKSFVKSPGGAKKFVHYSAHDLTLIVVLGMLDEWSNYPKRPDYASNIAIELHQDNVDNVWYVRILYMPKVPNLPFELNLSACAQADARGRCRLDRLEALARPYLVPNWQTWMSECRNNLKLIDPYIVGH